MLIDNVHPKPNNGLRTDISREDILVSIQEIDRTEFPRLIGLVAHLCYWTVFGHINQNLPLDPYYKSGLFVTINQIKAELEMRYVTKRKFITLIMPILILVIRIEMEVIFKNTYPCFFQNEKAGESQNCQIAMKLLNQTISAVFDPNLFYSRFPFYESDKKAIDIKLTLEKKKWLDGNNDVKGVGKYST